MDFKKLPGKILKSFSLKKIGAIAALLFLVVLSIFLFRSCSFSKGRHKDVYVIGRDSSWYSLQLFGRERALQAFMNDLMAAIASEKGIKFQWVETNPSALL